MNHFETKTRQQEYVGADSYFVEYNQFVRDAAQSGTAQNAFIQGSDYLPHYQYDTLSRLHETGIDGDTFSARKGRTQEAILELEANRTSRELSSGEYDLAAGTHEAFLKKMLLAEAAKRLLTPGSSSDRETTQGEYIMLNRELFGDINKPTFDGIMTTEKERVQSIVVTNEASKKIQRELLAYFVSHDVNVKEAPLMIPEDLEELRTAVLDRFAKELSIVPETDQSVRYGVNDCVEIMNNSLLACGLYDKGWLCEEAPKKSVVSTSVDKKRVYLPSSANYSADEISRLIVHEIGVHAHRGQNGEETGIYSLKVGTANYADVEEGEGVVFETALAGNFDNPSFHRARDRYIVAGLALGADGAPRDARQTYEIAWRLIAVRLAEGIEMKDGIIEKAQSDTMRHIDNAYRGTNHAGPGVIYRKLKVYWEGLEKNAAFYSSRRGSMREAIDETLIGKIDHTDEHERATVSGIIATQAA